MSISGSAQISPRVLAAYERLEEAVGRLNSAVETQADKVDAREVETLKVQLDRLKQDNLALSDALEAYSEADYDTQFEQLKEKIEELESENTELKDGYDSLKENNDSLKELNSDISERLGKLIGNVQQVLEEE